MNKAFTFIELLIILGITVIIATTGTLRFFKYRVGQNLDLTAKEIAMVLRNAQNRSISQDDSDSWGVYFNNLSTNDYYDLFKGASYDPANVVSRISLRSNIEFNLPSSGTTLTIVFSKFEGFPSASTTVRVNQESNPLDFKNIVINGSGQISF
ncbi:MAG: hypothetical protein AAB596_01490 [Patescibacteria group bacterium]